MTVTRPMFHGPLPYLAYAPRADSMRLAVQGALSAALLVGGGCQALAHHLDPAAQVRSDLAHGEIDKAVQQGEADVALHPREAAPRAELGHIYMHAGRFESAMAAFAGAISLGDTSDRTELGLALAQIACGQDQGALATLDRASGVIAPGDLGLAIALAGDTGRGIAVLTDAVRGGDSSPKLRQNLAYAYALDGRWADARLTASFDVPGDQLDARLGQWAQSMQSGGERDRVARLLGVPVIADSGMPQLLALNQAAPAATSAPQLATVKTDANGELPALAETPASSAVSAHAVPAAAAVAVVSAPTPAPVSAAAPTMAAVVPAVVAPVWHVPATATSLPLPVHAAVLAPEASAPEVSVHVSHRFRLAMASEGRAHLDHVAHHWHHANLGHVVQLGAFASARSAQRAKLIYARRDQQLHGHDFAITEAVVNGRNYWRVVSTAYDAPSATNVCASLKRHGGACFAYAADHAPGEPAPALALSDTRGPSYLARRR